jgi:epoxide hydrolase 4
MRTTEDRASGELREAYADVGDVRLHYVEAGEGPLVVLLHGFPEFCYGWREQIGPLAAAGFRVVAPDMRGYKLSFTPDGVHAHDTGRLAADIAGLIRERGAAPTLVIWGQADRYLGQELAEPDDVPGLDRVGRLPDASHWVHSRRG